MLVEFPPVVKWDNAHSVPEGAPLGAEDVARLKVIAASTAAAESLS